MDMERAKLILERPANRTTFQIKQAGRVYMETMEHLVVENARLREAMAAQDKLIKEHLKCRS